MSGTHSTGFFFGFSCFSVAFFHQLQDGCAISSLSLWHAMTLLRFDAIKVHDCFALLGLVLSTSWTCREGGDKSYTSICDAAVIARLLLRKEYWVGRGSANGAGSRHEYARGVSNSWEVVLCLRSKRFPMHLWAFADFFFDSGYWMRKDL